MKSKFLPARPLVLVCLAGTALSANATLAPLEAGDSTTVSTAVSFKLSPVSAGAKSPTVETGSDGAVATPETGATAISLVLGLREIREPFTEEPLYSAGEGKVVELLSGDVGWGTNGTVYGAAPEAGLVYTMAANSPVNATSQDHWVLTYSYHTLAFGKLDLNTLNQPKQVDFLPRALLEAPVIHDAPNVDE